MNPLVSLISPCYNGANYLRPFLESVVSQTYHNIEFIFVDDGSTDNTKEILFSYKSKFEENGIKLCYIYKENGGQASAINAALPIFSGEFLMWCDSDDILLPENIEKKVSFLEKHSECGFVLSHGVAVSNTSLNVPLWHLGRKVTAENDDLFADLIFERNVVYGPATILVRREVFLSAIPTLTIYEGKQGQNWQLMLPLAYNSKAGYLEDVLFKYVIHSDSHSHKKLSYEEQIKRDNDFELLIITTIASIPDISTDEVNRWYRSVRIKYLRQKLRHSFDYLKIKESREYKKELMQYDSLTNEDIMIIYLFYKFVRKIKYRPKRKNKEYVTY